ncbi:hypothetical protein K504DRAFT_447677 [Pleomassaria siparia CBS 279.74]|uniref:Uncharacterized protein n=1 Tax=Pleomassaria siparia CBS 279.74 TaxID=1314801 RepID=A0A6G1K1P1_9PLEO|nr:hypothetical protein K504DRAFT_447677 [Pleomassaria siparia CBS 279.74]
MFGCEKQEDNKSGLFLQSTPNFPTIAKAHSNDTRSMETTRQWTGPQGDPAAGAGRKVNGINLDKFCPVEPSRLHILHEQCLSSSQRFCPLYPLPLRYPVFQRSFSVSATATTAVVVQGTSASTGADVAMKPTLSAGPTLPALSTPISDAPLPALPVCVPGNDPVGAFSISVISVLLSLLKKDPVSLFAPSLPILALVTRDMPEHHAMRIPQLDDRQLGGLPLPSLSQRISGVGIASLPLCGIPDVSPGLAALVDSIAKKIAIPGGSGLGSVTGTILSALDTIVPEFVFQLPAV